MLIHGAILIHGAMLIHGATAIHGTMLIWGHVNTWDYASLVPSPPLPLTKWPRKRWSGIFGPIPWLASTHLEYFWPVRLPLHHVPTKPCMSLIREDIGDDSQTYFFGSWICHRTGSQSWTIHNPRKNAYTLRLHVATKFVHGFR